MRYFSYKWTDLAENLVDFYSKGWSKFLHFSAKAVYRKGAVDRKWLKAKHRNPNLKDEVSLLYVFEGGSSALS